MDALWEDIALLSLRQNRHNRLTKTGRVLLQERFGQVPPPLDFAYPLPHAFIALRSLHTIQHLSHPLRPGAQFQFTAGAASALLVESLRDEALCSHTSFIPFIYKVDVHL